VKVHRQPLWLRKIAFVLNYFIYLKFGAFQYGSIRPIISDKDRGRLEAIPEGAGNILVGPHPSNQDAHLLFHLFAQTRTDPVLFLMAAETYLGGTFLRRWVLDELGVIPVNRGRSSPEIIEAMIEHISRGWWGGLFPEGDVYFSREVMPMEIGVLRIAVQAALKVQSRTGQKNGSKKPIRPIFITPFAHVCFLRNPNLSRSRLEEAIIELERRSADKNNKQCQNFADRLRSLADQILEHKALEYGIPEDKWQHPDRFLRISRLQHAVLEQLEIAYFGRVQSGYSRRRAMKIRAICVEKLEDKSISDLTRNIIEKDTIKIRELILMTPFSHAYREKYGDLEMWVEYMRRFYTALSIPKKDFGPEDVVFRILEPIDVHLIASEYKLIFSQREKKNFLINETEALRKIIQAGVDGICSQRSTMKIPD